MPMLPSLRFHRCGVAGLLVVLLLAGCAPDRAASLNRWLDAETRSCLDAIAQRQHGDLMAGDPYREYLFSRAGQDEVNDLLTTIQSVRDEGQTLIKDVRARDLMRRKIDLCLMLINSIRQDASLGVVDRRSQINDLQALIDDTVAIYAADD